MNTPQTISALSRPVPLPDTVAEWSGVATNYPANRTIASLFEDIASKCSQRIALTSGGKNVTYSELDMRANQLAERLRRMGVQQETLVACVMDRSIEYIVAILGILKAGGAYVPIDPAFPDARMSFLLEDTQAQFVVANRHPSTLPSTRADILEIREDGSPTSYSEYPEPQTEFRAADGNSLAYVMYTSGSTGEPKGVLVENRGVVRLVRNTNYCRFGPDEIFLQLAPVSFDASTFEIWGALLNGSRLVVMPAGNVSIADIGSAIERYGITTMWLTAPLFHLMVEERMEALAQLRQLLAGGDVLSPRHVRRFLENAPNTTLVNGYGPTESTTFTCCHVMRHGASVPESVPIGKPVSNSFVYILDERFVPMSVGEAGELCAGGDGVARGYLNRPADTAAKFLPDPFANAMGRRLYRSGDRARWRSDGTIEFLGRMDAQVKILGHRVEPGEIESVILKNKAVKDACVVPNEDSSTGYKRLVAYFVPTRPGVAIEEIRRLVSSELPQYMVPGFFVAVDALPLSFNGKVDREVLGRRPVPEDKAAAPEQRLVGSQLETEIAALWRGVLHRREIGFDENFFDLGGDSLLLVSVHSKLQKVLNREIPVTDLFAWPTVRGLARHLSSSDAGHTDLSGAQERATQQRQAFHRWREQHSAADRE